MAKILKTVCPTNNDDVDADITSHAVSYTHLTLPTILLV